MRPRIPKWMAQKYSTSPGRSKVRKYHPSVERLPDSKEPSGGFDVVGDRVIVHKRYSGAGFHAQDLWGEPVVQCLDPIRARHLARRERVRPVQERREDQVRDFHLQWQFRQRPTGSGMSSGWNGWSAALRVKASKRHPRGQNPRRLFTAT